MPLLPLIHHKRVPIPTLAEKPGQVESVFWLFIITLVTIPYYLVFHGLSNLHDMSHYLTSGVQLIRDHSDLIYPYSSMDPEGGGSAYGYLQDNGRLLDVHKNYPSKLYFSLFSLFYLASPELKFYWAHIISFLAIATSNIFIYLIGRRFFIRSRLLLFILTATFAPVVAAVINPSNDSLGYLLSIILLWACTSTPMTPLVIGLLIGTFAHFRSQLIFFICILPFIISHAENRWHLARSFIHIGAGGIVTYILVGEVFKLFTPATPGNYGGLDFYIKNFSESFYSIHDIPLIIEKLRRNWAVLSSDSTLYIFLFAGIFTLAARGAPLARSLALCGLLYAAFPFLIYSLDRYSDPHARYYAGAVPYLVLAWYLTIDKLGKTGEIIQSGKAALLTTIVTLIGWLSINGLPLSNASSLNAIESRLNFLDFPDASKTINEHFSNNDLIIANHSLPAGLANLKNIVPMPDFNEFRNGYNKQVDGIIFVFGNEQPNSYFKRPDWETNGSLPQEITDKSGTRFKKVLDLQSRTVDGNGNINATARLVAYKNPDATKRVEKDESGNEVFTVAEADEFSELAINSPRFASPSDWNGKLRRAIAGSDDVLAGPGPDNENVLSQRFPTSAGERLRISAMASSGLSRPVKARLQINWLDPAGNFLSATIGVIDVGLRPQRFQKTVESPAGAAWGIVYVSPHRSNDVIRFSEMKVLRKAAFTSKN